ncbi:MAG: mechanosensitive ion channel domain-containing protein, partial [Pseudomonadota bacterium]
RAQAQDNLPLVVALVILGVALLGRSRHWSELLAMRIQRTAADSTAGVAGFFVSLGQIILPMLGLLALLRAVGATDLFGARAQLILNALEPMGFTIFFALWLGSRIFPRDEALPTPLTLPHERRTEGRIYTFVLGATFAVFLLLQDVADFERYGLETLAVLQFPLIVLAAVLTLRVGWLMRRKLRDAEGEAPTERPFGARLIRLLGQGAIVVGLLAPLLAAAGYGTAAKELIFPYILTLAMFGVLALLQQLVRDIYTALRPGHAAADSLIPTLVGFMLMLLASIPLALIWGARSTDLTDIWEQMRRGLTVGDMTISPGSFFTLIVVFTLGYLLTRGAQSAMRTSVLPKTKLDPGGQTAIVAGLGYVGIFLAALVAITSAGIDLSNIAIVAGALSVGIGFGLQTIVSNFVSGIILLIERPISEGDWIEVGGQMGYVRNISVRSTRIETFDRTDVIVPNADLISGTVTNYTRGNTVGRVIIPVGVAYGTDTRRVEGILREIAEAHPMALANPAPMILFAGFGADSLDFEIRIILRDVNWSLSVRNDINHQIAERFVAEGIEIPFAQRDVWLRNPETLQSGAAAAQAAPPAPQPEIDPDIGGTGDADGDGDGR